MGTGTGRRRSALLGLALLFATARARAQPGGKPKAPPPKPPGAGTPAPKGSGAGPASRPSPPLFVPPGLEPASLGLEVVAQKGNVFMAKVVDPPRLAKYKVAGVRPGDKVKVTVTPGRIAIVTPKGKDRPPVLVITGPAGKGKFGQPYQPPPLPTALPAGMEAQFVALQAGGPKGAKPPTFPPTPTRPAPTPKAGPPGAKPR